MSANLGFTQVQSYMLLQVSKDGQNRSNVDALIHKVVPSDQVGEIRRARKQYFERQPMTPAGNTNVNNVAPQKQDSAENANAWAKMKDQVIKDFVERKPVLRTKNFEISPDVVNLRNKPSLVYELDTNTVLKAIKDFLSSATVRKYTDDVAKTAAMVYRSYVDRK